ncbi:MAG: signal peptidase II [Lachnospiraceae bacterium]|nr:signal peptidase II [Lachnospiraceae bacterium]
MNRKIRITIDIIIMAVLVLIDQLTKNWAVNNLKDADPVILIKGVLQLYYLPSGNTGAAFGILSGHRILFLCIAAAVVGVILFLLIRLPIDRRFTVIRILLIFIAAGGIGNMIDRFVLTYVIDFIYFYLINFPIFNVADCYVTVATIILAFLILFKYKEEDMKLLEKSILKKDKTGDER